MTPGMFLLGPMRQIGASENEILWLSGQGDLFDKSLEYKQSRETSHQNSTSKTL